MSALAPAWALGCFAIATRGDPHLPDGVHLRLVPSPDLGLPAHPFLLTRVAMLKEDSVSLAWFDAEGNARLAGGSVDVTTAGGVVTGLLLWRSEDVAGLLVDGAGLDSVELLSEHGGVIGARTASTVVFGGRPLRRLRIHGRGVVEVRVLRIDGEPNPPASDEWVQRLGLPLPKDATGYAGGDPVASLERVKRAAPARTGPLDDVVGLPLKPDDEWQRVRALTGAPAFTQALEAVGRGPTGLDGADNSLSSLLLAAADPGVARYLGLLATDQEPQSGWFAGYVVAGIWLVSVTRMLWGARLIDLLPAPQNPNDPLDDPWAQRCLDEWPDLGARLEGFRTRGYVPRVLVSQLGVSQDPAQAGEPPPRPELGPAVARPWRAGLDPRAPRYGARVPISGVAPLGLVSAVRRAGDMVWLNREITVAAGARHCRAGLVMAQPTPENPPPALHDHDVPPDAAGGVYRVAQTDAFGRWSDWAETPVPDPPPRPAVPVPALELDYRWPQLLTDDPAGRAGTLVARVRLPTTVAPGEVPIDALVVAVDVLYEDHVVSTIPGPTVLVGDAGGGALTAEVAGPEIRPTGSVEVAVRAHFVAGGTPSAEAAVRRWLYDPRPPARLERRDTLTYTARPDATGTARLELDWRGGNERYRVYVATEAQLVHALPASSDALTALAAEPDATPARRATILRDHSPLLRRGAFGLVTPAPVLAPSGTSPFVHPVSGSLRDLLLVKVVGVSAAGVEAPFEGAPLWSFAVPTSQPPPPPLLDVEIVDGRARLTVVALAGERPATRYRLRRTVTGITEAAAMPLVVRDAELGPPDAEGHASVVVDQGLAPFVRTTWVAEVSCGLEPGSADTPSPWSPPSAPAGGVLVPAHGPPAVAARVVGTQPVTVSCRLPDGLPTRRTTPPYRLELYLHAAAPSEPVPDATARLDTKDVDPATPPVLVDHGGTPGTQYAVVLVDPIGRFSPAVVVTA